MPVFAAIPAIIGSVGSAIGGGLAAIGGGSALAGGLKVASLAGSLLGNHTSSGQLAGGAQNAIDAQLGMYNQTRSDLQPFFSTGTSAINQLGSLFGLGTGGPSDASAAAATSALTKYPGYQFGFDQGIRGLDASAASRGMLLSGAQLKGAQQFGNNYAMQQAWQPYLQQLNTMASLGENAAAQTGNAGTQAGQGIASSQLALGQAQAAGTTGVSQTLQSSLQNFLLGQKGGGGSPLSAFSDIASPLSQLSVTAAANPIMNASFIPFPSFG